MKRILMVIPLLSSLLLQGQKSDPAIRFSVNEAPEWSNLFKRDSGWFGGDGIFVIPLNGKENLDETDTTTNIFLFSDTMFGRIDDSVLLPGYNMVNNSIAILRGHDAKPSMLEFRVLIDSMNTPRSLFTPLTSQSGKDDYLWLGDGFVNTADGSLNIFAYRIVNIPEVKDFGFRVVGSLLIKIPEGSTYPFAHQIQTDLPVIPENSRSGGGHFGSAIFVNTREANAPSPDGFIYIYAVTGTNKSLVVARVIPEDFDEFRKWRFWNGKEWSTKLDNMEAIAGGISNEASICPVPGGKYALVFQATGMSRQTVMCIGDSPIGPFSEPMVLYDCASDMKSPNFYAYNAKAHPSLSKPGELIISYNVNSFDFFEEIKRQPHLYRPRFIKVKFE